jgi:hypothetical protein
VALCVLKNPFIYAASRNYIDSLLTVVDLGSEHDSSGPQTSPDDFFSANELSNWLRRDEALGDVNAILDPKQSPSVRIDNHMRPQEWERFLSDAPRKLSLLHQCPVQIVQKLMMVGVSPLFIFPAATRVLPLLASQIPPVIYFSSVHAFLASCVLRKGVMSVGAVICIT